MCFIKKYNSYKEEHELVTKFFTSLSLLTERTIFEECNIDTNHTFNDREHNTIGTCEIDYPSNINYITLIKRYDLEHGLYCNPENITINDLDDYNRLLEGDSYILVAEPNTGVKFEIDTDMIKFDNYKKSFFLNFKLTGNMEDFDVLDAYRYYVKFNVIDYSENAEYWGKLLLQGCEFKNEMKFDIAFLILFSAFENFITLEIEKITDSYYKEFNIKELEFIKKVKLLLKHHLCVESKGREDHPIKNLIIKLLDSLYKIRNKVAHGNKREIEEVDCDLCLDMFIFTYTAIYHKPKDNIELLKKIKNYN